MLKLIGLFAVFLSSSAIGLLRAAACGAAVREEEALLEFARHVSREIADHMTSLSDIFLQFENEVLEKNGFLERIRSRSEWGDMSAQGAIFEEWERSRFLSSDAESILREFWSTLGTLPYAAQCDACRKCITALEITVKKDKIDALKRASIWRSAGALAGAACVLLLI